MVISWTDRKKSSVLGCLSRVANAVAPIIETGGGFVRGLEAELDDLELEYDSRFEDNFRLGEDLEGLGLEDDLELGLDLELAEDLEDLGLEDNLGIDVVICGGSGSSCNSIVFP